MAVRTASAFSKQQKDSPGKASCQPMLGSICLGK